MQEISSHPMIIGIQSPSISQITKLSQEQVQELLAASDKEYNRSNFSIAFQHYSKIISDDTTGHARFRLGQMYKFGDGIERNQTKAESYFTSSFPLLCGCKNNPTAWVDLGWMYANGEGVSQDKKNAVALYKLAVDKGNARAQCNLGLMYECGDGVKKKQEEGRDTLSTCS